MMLGLDRLSNTSDLSSGMVKTMEDWESEDKEGLNIGG